MQPVLSRYLDKVIKDNQTIDARGVMQVNRMIELSMDEVYVNLTVRMGSNTQSNFSRAARGKMVHGVSPESYDHIRGLLGNEIAKYSSVHDLTPDLISPSVETGFPTEELWSRSNRWVLLGDPGAGKTTLLKHFALQSARACKQGKGYLPVLLPLRLFAAEWAQQPNWTVQNAVLNYLAGKGLSEMGFEQAQARKELLGYIEQALREGLALLLFDGLDEQRDVASQSRSVAAIESLSSRHLYNRILVSSRTIGYDAAPLGPRFCSATLEPFNDEQMEAFFRKWIYAVEIQEDIVIDANTKARAKEKTVELIEQINANPGIRTLTTNPLLCTIIGLIRRQGATLPQLRAELYKLCIDTFIFNWELQKRRRTDQDNSLDKDQTQAVLEELALHFHENRPENREPQQAISEVIKNFLVAHQGMAADAAASKAEQLLSLIRDVSGLLINRGNNEFGFFHLTFQEYLTARAITRRKRDIERYLRQHLLEPRWREVIRLAAAHQGMKDEETGSEFIETILRCTPPREELMHYAFRIAFLCLKEARVLLATSDAMLREWIRLYLSQPEWRELLLQLMRQPGAAIRHRDDVLQPLLDAIMDESSFDRVDAAKALGQFKEPAAWQALLGAFRDKHIDVRSIAARALVQSKEPAALQALVDDLRDEDLSVSWVATRALTLSKEPAAVQALLGALTDKNSVVRSNAAEALAYFEEPSVRQALLEALKDEDGDVRICAAEALAHFKEPAALPTLLESLNNADIYIRKRAAEALSQFKVPTALQALLGELKDKEGEVRSSAAWALAQFKEPAALQALLGALNDEDPFTRMSAVWALAQLKDPAALQALPGALKDEDPYARMSAAAVLAQFKEPAALQVLLEAIKDEDSSVRRGAAGALGQFKEVAALQALLEALKDEDNDVRSSALNSIEQIDLGAALCPD